MKILLFILVCFPFLLRGQTYDKKLTKLINANELSKAQIRLEKVYGEDTTSIDYLFLKGKINRKIGDYDASKEYLQEVLKLDSTYANAWDELGVLYTVLQSNSNLGMRLINHAIELNPNNADYLSHKGSIYYIKKEYEAALTEYKKAIALSPKDDYILYNIGSCYLMLGKYELSLTYLSKAIHKRKDTKNYFERGRAFYYLKNYAAAKKDFRKALKLNSTENEYEMMEDESIERFIRSCEELM